MTSPPGTRHTDPEGSQLSRVRWGCRYFDGKEKVVSSFWGGWQTSTSGENARKFSEVMSFHGWIESIGKIADLASYGEILGRGFSGGRGIRLLGPFLFIRLRSGIGRNQ